MPGGMDGGGTVKRALIRGSSCGSRQTEKALFHSEVGDLVWEGAPARFARLCSTFAM